MQGAVIGAAVVVGMALAAIRRAHTFRRERSTLGSVSALAGLAGAVAPRRRVYAALLALVGFPLVTWALTLARSHLNLADDLLIYLILVVAVSVIGGLVPAVAAAIAASLLLNWFFTHPLHTFTIDQPDNLLALLLFVIVAVSVSTVVHLAARRADLAVQSRSESEALLRLARLVLAGHDSPAAILDHLHQSLGISTELQELTGDTWVRIAASGSETEPERRVDVRPDLRLLVGGPVGRHAARIIDAAAGQCAAALDRERLRTQAAQAEALAAGNRMRTALLAAVSHDLRTPLASLKAGVSSLRQTDVAWSAEDEAELLETIEDSTDRLTELIASLLDMSRITTGALQPYLRPAVVEEIVPGALAGLPGQDRVMVDIPDDLPLVRTDPVLLQRALANVLSNALRHSSAPRPPHVIARVTEDGRISIAVIDHGPGVLTADRERIFEPFQRLGDQHPSTGVGLGLAVARGFVESVGGTIAAEETPEGGLTMTVTIPAVQAMAPLPAAQP